MFSIVVIGFSIIASFSIGNVVIIGVVIKYKIINIKKVQEKFLYLGRAY